MINNILSTAAYVTVAFSGLSSDKDLASQQKTLIAEALRAVFSEPSAFIEEHPNLSLEIERDLEHWTTAIHCEHCSLHSMSHKIDHSSIRFQTTSKTDTEFRITFDLDDTGRSRDGGSVNARQSWVLNGKIAPLFFAVRPGTALRAGELISQDSLKIVPCLTNLRCGEKDTHRTYALAESAIQSYVNLSPKRSLSPNKHIGQNDFRRPITIRRGSPVKVSYKSSSGLAIESNGTALEDGAIGETIEIRLDPIGTKQSQNSRKKLSAVVTSEGQVTHER